MDIGWFFELSQFADENPSEVTKNAHSGAKKQPKRGYIDQIPGF
ncbi:hypothetical protein WBM82_11595 [Bacillus subtilis]